MMDTIQRIIGLVVGVIVSLLLLIAMTDIETSDAAAVLVPLIVGAVAAFFWPVVVGWFVVRRAKQRRENQIQSEVERQMKDQQRGG